MLELYGRRAASLAPAQVARRFAEDRFVQPSIVS